MVVRAVIWDVGGVLVRTEDYTSRDALAKRMGVSRSDLERLVFADEGGRKAQLGEISYEQHWENTRLQLNYSPDEIEAFRESFWAGDKLDIELVDYIRSLHPYYRTGLLSNAFSDLRRLVTQEWRISDAFDAMIISAEVGLMKPDLRIYQLALKHLDVAAGEAVFIDDFLHNVQGAQAADMQAIHFQNPVQARAELEKILNGESR